MAERLEDLSVADGERVAPADIPVAVMAGGLVYDDGAVQVFDHGGGTTYVEGGHPTHGEWYVDGQGRFCSFWPPAYRACYELRWIVDEGSVSGLRFTELNRGTTFAGRYR